MGGNCIKDAVRMDKERYAYMCKKITQVLNSPQLQNRDTKHFDFKIVDAYREKDSFGDIDIVIEVTAPDIRRKIESAICHWPEFTFMTNNKVTMVPNGPVTSFGILGHQVDLIYEHPSHYNFSCNYYSYNDMCNLIGRITHKMGFKFGHDGLWYILRDGDYVVADILITTNFDKALECFGFDSKRFKEGFNNLTEIFEYIISNKYFNPDIYLLQNRNHTARVRDKKRKTYAAFLEYCESKEFKTKFEFNEDKSEYLDIVFDSFPKFKSIYLNEVTQNQERKSAKNKLTTEIVMNHCGLKDRQLGDYIKATTSIFSNPYNWHVLINLLSIPDLLKFMDKNYNDSKGN